MAAFSASLDACMDACSAIYGAIEKTPLDTKETVLSGLECLYYDLIRRDENLPQIVQKVCDFVISHIDNLQAMFTLVNCTSLLLVSKRCIDLAKESSPLLDFLNQEVPFHLIPGFALGLLGISYKIFPQVSYKELSNEEGNKEPLSELSRYIHIARFIANLAILYFTQSPFKMAFNLLCLGYSFSKSLQLHWIESPLRNVPGRSDDLNMTSYQVFYRTLSIEGEGKNKTCSSCKQESINSEPFPEVVSHYSKKHIFHKACLQQEILNQARERTVFPHSFIPEIVLRRHLHPNKLHSHTDELRSWRMTYPSEAKAEKNLPQCPHSDCQEKLSMEHIRITVLDKITGRNHKAEIKFTEGSS